MGGHKAQNSLFQERTCNDHLVLLPPPHFRADQKLKHFMWISQMPLKHWQAWGTYHFSQQPVPVLDCQTGLKLTWNDSSREHNNETDLTDHCIQKTICTLSPSLELRETENRKAKLLFSWVYKWNNSITWWGGWQKHHTEKTEFHG